MKILTSYILVFTSIFFSGCKKDERLAPLPNGMKVSITVRLPSDLEVSPLGVMYRSNICHKKRINAYGKSFEEPGYNFIEIELKREGNGNDFSSLVPSDGGGQCGWRLSNITIDVKFKASEFKEKIDDVVGAGVIVVFDSNHPQRYDGVYKNTSGDLMISMEYFPWFHERFLNKHSKYLWTYGKKNVVNYRTKNTYKVVFSPVTYSNLVTHSTGPKIKKPNGDNFTRFVYPDGVVVENGGPYPDFKKLEAIAHESNNNSG